MNEWTILVVVNGECRPQLCRKYQMPVIPRNDEMIRVDIRGRLVTLRIENVEYNLASEDFEVEIMCFTYDGVLLSDEDMDAMWLDGWKEYKRNSR